jgi:threonine dehydrogenase-like Zn-dependent dehydrogenase
MQEHMPLLLEAIGNGLLRPSAIISHRMALQDAVLGYALFADKREDCRKVVLTP